MSMQNGLTSSNTDVYSDVEAANGLILCQMLPSHHNQQAPNVCDLLLREHKQVWYVAGRDDECMARSDGE
jgi:hypothetical protein